VGYVQRAHRLASALDKVLQDEETAG
jgi:hypothetical protein